MDINAHVKRAKGQAWFQRPLWPLLIALHCGATLLFFALYAPQSRQHDGDSLQAGLSATEQDALGEANIIEQPVKKVIYATVRAHRVAEQTDKDGLVGPVVRKLPHAVASGNLAAADNSEVHQQLSWAYPNTGEPLKVVESQAILESLPDDRATPVFSIVVAAYEQARQAIGPLRPLSLLGHRHGSSYCGRSAAQGKFIEETFKSVVEQSYPWWEMIIVDDGSPDDTWERARTLRLVALALGPKRALCAPAGGSRAQPLDRFTPQPLQMRGARFQCATRAVQANALLEAHPKARLRLVQKRNGGLADARNVGLRYARGGWLCMLDSDDLLGREYLQRAAEVVVEDPGVGIIPGCMHNFDAVASDWCFPEGYSLMGLAHWNKFHASVLLSAALMRSVGGYDPALPWGLEDWNFWLHAALHNPRVRFLPEATFWYRQHAGGSMRKAMFASHLEETKAMVRTNHAELYEPAQLLRDHEVIAAMSAETLLHVNDKIAAFPTAGMPRFWRALHRLRELKVELALLDLRSAAALVTGQGSWQVSYHTALLLEASDDLPGALEAINTAFRGAYCDDVLAAKYRIEGGLGAAAGPLVGAVTVRPSYWGDEAALAEIREGTLAGKLARLARLEAHAATAAAERETMLATLAAVAAAPCTGKGAAWLANQVRNPSFESGPDQWFAYGLGFAASAVQPRPGAQSVLSAVLHVGAQPDSAGAMQVVALHQAAAAPLLVRGWSRAMNVSGAADSGYAVYIDINFADGTHEWGWSLPFDTGTHDWQLRRRHLVRDKAIATLDLYIMLRGHTGSAWFDDVSISAAAAAACACPAGEMFSPGAPQSCERCTGGKLCLFGESFDVGPAAAAGRAA